MEHERFTLSEKGAEPIKDVADDTFEKERCGAFGWRPSWLQCCVNVKAFTVCLSLVNLVTALSQAYYTAIITQIERRFGLSSSITGFLKNADNIGYFLTIIFVSHFCRSSNKPRLFAFSCVLSSFAILLFTVPHFMFGSGYIRPLENNEIYNRPTLNTTSEQQLSQRIILCGGQSNATNNGTNRCDDASQELFTYNEVAVIVFTISAILQGIGQAPIMVLGITYMDDNSGGKSPEYLGYMFALRSIGPVFGFLLAAWTNSIYADIADPGFGPDDERWVGAWWIGFVVCAGLMAVSSIPMLLFPSVLKRNGVSTNDARESLLSKGKDLPRALCRLLRNRLYITIVLGICIEMYIIGYLTFLPKYFEVHYGQTASFASVLLGSISAIVWSVGPIVSGKIASKKLQSSYSMMKFILGLSIASLAGFGLLILLACPEQKWADRQRDLAKYGANCKCPRDLYQPVCGADDMTYITACHAGCKQMTHLNTSPSIQRTFSECIGVLGITATASAGKCDVMCGHLLFGYVAIFFITAFTVSMCIIPIYTITIRCVSHRDKALSLALSTGLFQIILFPAPIVYGYTIDSTCSTRDNSCGHAGACIIYDTTQLRLRFHGLTLGLKTIAGFIFVASLMLSRKDNESDAQQKQCVHESERMEPEIKSRSVT